MNSLELILKYKIVAIIRGVEPDDVLAIAEALYKGGIRILEITLNSPKALEVIKDISSKVGDKILVGAGTVLDASAASEAIEAGAKFIISPIVDVNTIRITRQLGAVSIPGAYTATEIVLAYNNGADIIKVFPASIGAAYINDLRGPLPHIPMMPTGGVQLSNIEGFKKAGVVAYGVGSALVDSKQAVTDEYLKALTLKAEQFVEAVNR